MAPVPCDAMADPYEADGRGAPLGLKLGRNPWSGSLAARVKSPRAQGALAALGFLALAGIVFHRQLFDGFSFPWDFVGAYSASPAFVGASVGHLHFYAWSPYVASGFPVGVDPQSGLYFPVWWLLGALHIPITLSAVVDVQIVHVLLGATGVALLARVRGLDWPWAGLAGAAYLFFGGFYGESEHADIFRGFAYLPCLLWALTPPRGEERWTRLVTVPVWGWLIVSGAYPGQIASFAIVAAVYLVVCVALEARARWRRFVLPLALVAVACGATAAAVLLPYLHAQDTNQLVRVVQPTFSGRAGASLSVLDLLGLYLNNFAWTYDGTVTAWAVGIPVLVGVACIRMSAVRRQAPLIVCGALGLALAMTPKIAPIGHAMVSLSSIFSSRFPASDYKAAAAIALVVVAADSWRDIAARVHRPYVRAAAMAAAIVVGALVAPSTYALPTGAVWLIAVVAVLCVAIAALRPTPRLLVAALLLLVCVDGAREVVDYRALGTVSPWAVSPAGTRDYRARDSFVRVLAGRLEHPPATRPARVGEFASLVSYPTGTDPDAAGWTGDGYHLIDYGGTIERPLWDAEHDPQLRAKLLEPWHAYTFPCGRVSCGSRQVTLPKPASWHPDGGVTTSSYGPQGIVYHVHATHSEVMVENELALPGWHTSSTHVSAIDAGLPLRTWRLSAGTYTFTETFAQPSATGQLAAAAVAVLAALGCALVLWPRRRH